MTHEKCTAKPTPTKSRTTNNARPSLPLRPWPRGGPTPTVIAHHSAKDKDHGLASAKREEVFRSWASPNIRTFVSPQGPTRVAVLMDGADRDVVRGAMMSQYGEEASDA